MANGTAMQAPAKVIDPKNSGFCSISQACQYGIGVFVDHGSSLGFGGLDGNVIPIRCRRVDSRCLRNQEMSAKVLQLDAGVIEFLE